MREDTVIICTCAVAGDTEAAFLAESRCGTAAALNYTATCDPCAGCLLGQAVSMDGRCEDYALCVACQASCTEYSSCFAESVVNRASAPGGTVCERMGLVNNGWCDEDAAESKCTAVQSLVAISGETGLCKAGEDRSDCEAHACNFGCKVSCEDKCTAIFNDPLSADACGCKFGCAMARGESPSPFAPENVSGELCEDMCESHCGDDGCTCGCADGQCCTIDGVSADGKCFSSETRSCDACDDSPCKVGCNMREDTNHDKDAQVHWEPACANSSKLLSKTSDMVQIWMYDRRFNLQLDTLMPIPMMLSMLIPMIIETLLPLLCLSWQKGNRMQGRHGRCTRWCCRRASYADDVTAGTRGCCVRAMNCFMCDDDQGVGSSLPTEALPDLTDEELAAKLTEVLEAKARARFGSGGGLREDRQKVAAEQLVSSTLVACDGLIFMRLQHKYMVTFSFLRDCNCSGWTWRG